MNVLIDLLNDAGGWLSTLTVEALGILVAILVAIAVMAIVLGLASTNIRENRLRRDRLNRAVYRQAGSQQKKESTVQLRRIDPKSSLDKSLGRLMPKPDMLRARLKQTGRKMAVGNYAAASIVVAILSFFVLWRFTGLPPVTSAFGAAASGLMIPHLIVSHLIRRRRNLFTGQLAEGIDVMVRGIRAGLPVSETVRAVAKEVGEPVRGVFALVADRVRVGEQMEDAFAHAAEEMDTPELKFLAITLSVQRETGGNLAETLSNLSEILRKRRQMKLKIRAVSSEARASAMILGSLPFVMFLVLLLVNQGYVMELFVDPRGHFLVGASLFSMAIGIGVMMKMVRFDI